MKTQAFAKIGHSATIDSRYMSEASHVEGSFARFQGAFSCLPTLPHHSHSTHKAMVDDGEQAGGGAPTYQHR